MLKKLRLRLALVCALMTGAVLAAMLLAIALLTENQYRQMNELLFQNSLSALINRLQTDRLIDVDWLAETEASQRCVLALENNGVPLRFRGAWTPPDERGRLIRDVRAKAEELGLDYKTPPLDITRPAQVSFLLDGAGGGRYRCAVVRIPTKKNWITLTVACEISAEQAHIKNQRLLYAGFFLAGFTALWLFSWWFTGRAVRPAVQNARRQREFVASASHELRSPLAVIGTTAAAIRVEPDRTEELTRGIEGECGRMGRLIDDLLLLANAGDAAWRIQLAAVELDTVLIEETGRYEQVAAERGFSLRLELPDEILPPVLGDPLRLGQLFSILLDNAVNHSGKPGEILVRAFAAGRFVTVEVIDHGVGIPPEGRDRVFGRFYRADPARSDKAHFGLGLSVAKELARLHGGSIRALETPGGGSTFRILFPAHYGAPPKGTDHPGGSEPF